MSAPSSAPLGKPGTWVAGGLATALILAWVLAGDACALRRSRNDPEALDLLRETASAARRTPYEGLQFRTTRYGGTETTSRIKVAHTPGDGSFVRMRGSSIEDNSSRPSTGYSADSAGTRAGLAGFTPATLTLLARNYAVVRTADASICGRSVKVVEARRPDGTPAGRFWIDAETGLMLHRELIDSRGRAVSTTGFTDLRITRPQGTVRLAQPLANPWTDQLVDTELSELRRDGWAVPASLPGRLSLHDARQAPPADGETVHLSYSDGLAAVSVFIQRGSLDNAKFTGWRKTASAGRTVFQRAGRQRWAVWASRGYVYTVLTDAPDGTSESVVAALPHGDTGFWNRMERGFSRLGSWANPWN